MIEYRADKRLYVLGGGLTVAQAMRPAAGVSDWWDVSGETCVAAYQAKGAADIDASYVNLANPGTYNLTTTAAPSFNTATGWAFSTGKLLNTGINVSSVLSTAATVIVRMDIVNQGTTAGRAIEAFDGSYNLLIIPHNGSAREYWFGNTSKTVSGALTGPHVMAIAAGTAYLDGSSEGAITVGGAPNGNIAIGNRTTGIRSLGGSIQAVAIYSTTLDSTQISDLTDAMEAL